MLRPFDFQNHIQMIKFLYAYKRDISSALLKVCQHSWLDLEKNTRYISCLQTATTQDIQSTRLSLQWWPLKSVQRFSNHHIPLAASNKKRIWYMQCFGWRMEWRHSQIRPHRDSKTPELKLVQILFRTIICHPLYQVYRWVRGSCCFSFFEFHGISNSFETFAL